jgi:hypothetical protein
VANDAVIAYVTSAVVGAQLSHNRSAESGFDAA